MLNATYSIDESIKIDQEHVDEKEYQLQILTTVEGFKSNQLDLLIHINSMRKRIICGSVWAFVFLAVGLFTILGLDSVINDFVLERVVLNPQTVDMWGAVPGSTNTLNLRSFTMFNFTNPDGFLYRNEKPKFNEISGYAYQSRSNFTNIRYSSDKSVIDYDLWSYFTDMPGARSAQEKVVTLNLGPLGFWHQLQTLNVATQAIYGFGLLFHEMSQTIMMQAIGQGLTGYFLPYKIIWMPICIKLGFVRDFCNILWQDPLYGFHDQNNYEIWIRWAYYNDSDSQIALYKYFGFKKVQMAALGRVLNDWIQSTKSAIENWYCDSQICQNNDIAIRQLSSGQITKNPPIGKAVDSVCMRGNMSCEGYPELFSFYKYVWPTIHNDSSFEDLRFSHQTLTSLFSMNNGTFMNLGNLSQLYNLGEAYDKGNVSVLYDIQKATHAQTREHALVIWEYTKYFAYEFVIKSSKKGNRKVSGLAQVFAPALYESFIRFSEWIMKQLLSLLIAEQIPNCSEFISATIEGISQQKVSALCQDLDAAHYQNYYRLIEPCQYGFFTDTFQQRYNLTGFEMSELCGPEDESVGKLLKNALATLHHKYGCEANKNEQVCTQFELGVKQFINSTITLNPPSSSIKQYPSAYSGRQWNVDLPEWEYRQFLSSALQDVSADKQIYSDYLRLADLLSFDKLFIIPKVQDLWLMDDEAEFQKTFYWKNMSLLKGYVKWVAIEVGFGGLTQTKSVKELLFGYEDPYLKKIKAKTPINGGDPSIDIVVALNGVNQTQAEAVRNPRSMYTGYSDPMMTRVYATNLNRPYITYNHTFFDGYEIKSQLISPYTEDVPLHGTDGVQNRPLSDPSVKQYIYIDNVYRIAEFSYDSPSEKYGFDLLKYKFSKDYFASSSENPSNSKYHQGLSGFMNVSFLGLPVFVSKNHFLDADSKWMSKVDIFDETGKSAIRPTSQDDSQLIIQPRTGAPFSVSVKIQTNVLAERDPIFTIDEILLPVFSVNNSAHLSEQACSQVLGQLKIALALPMILLIVSGVGIIAMISCVLYYCRSVKKRIVQESLLESTDGIDQKDEIQATIQKMNDE